MARLPPLRPGHRAELLEGSAQLFPALVEQIDGAAHAVWLETYICDFTGGGAEVGGALERAARRGVAVHVVVDGFGTPELAPNWRERFEAAGVQWRVYAPVAGLGVLRPGSWRRLHRKLCVVDDRVAFCGGINLLDDLHDPNWGALDAPRLDFAARLEGPVVPVVRAVMQRLWRRLQMIHGRNPEALSEGLLSEPASSVPATARAPGADSERSAAPGPDRVALLLRDNVLHRREIERFYLRAIGRAQREVIIANAYFVPGGRLRRSLMRAARRGVRVVLLLQGRYEYFMQYYASRPVYGSLLRAGVEIHEYAPSFLHAKVAVFDGRIATVGSSNLDPLSLLLAREANVVIDGPGFAAGLRERLMVAIARHGEAMDPLAYAARPWRERAFERIAHIVMRAALAVQGQKYL